MSHGFTANTIISASFTAHLLLSVVLIFENRVVYLSKVVCVFAVIVNCCKFFFAHPFINAPPIFPEPITVIFIMNVSLINIVKNFRFNI